MKRLVVEDSFWQLYPTAQIAFAAGCDMKTASEVSPEDAAKIAALLEETNALAKNRYQDEIFATISEITIWRQAFSKFKRKKRCPKHCGKPYQTRNLRKPGPLYRASSRHL